MTKDQVHLIQRRIDDYSAAEGSAEKYAYVLLKTGMATTVHRSLLPRQLARILRSSFKRDIPSIIYAPIRRAEILVKNNIRFFCLGKHHGEEGYSVKIGITSSFGRGSLAREIKAHQVISRKFPTSVLVPKLLDYDRKNLGWMREELIRADKHISAAQKADRFLGSVARDLYRTFAHSQPIHTSLRKAGVSFSEVRAVFKEAGTSTSSNVDASTWPVALAHGDLSPGNMVASQDGRLFLVDWERFGVAPTAFDLRSLYKFNPKHTLETLRSLGSPADADPKTQMQIALALDFVLFRRDRTRWWRYFQEKLGLTARQSSLHCEGAERDYLSQIAGIS